MPSQDLKKLHVFSEIKYKKLIDWIENLDRKIVLEKTKFSIPKF